MVSAMVSKISVRLPPERRAMSMAVQTRVRSSLPTRRSNASNASEKGTPTRNCWRKREISWRIGASVPSATLSKAWLMEKPARSALDIMGRASRS